MTWEPAYPNELPPSTDLWTMTAADVRLAEQSPDVLRCYTCGHSVHAHHADDTGSGGCSADQAPVLTLDGLVRAETRKPFVGGQTCACPGWVRGLIPYAITKHLTAVTDDDEAGCPQCEHPLAEHSLEQGCHCCPCTIHDA